MTSKDKTQTQVTESDKIWNEIKDLPIDMFALPNQVVRQHVQRVKVNPDELYLRLRSSSVITSLEEAINKDAHGVKVAKFQVEAAYGYTIIKRAVAPAAVPAFFKPETE